MQIFKVSGITITPGGIRSIVRDPNEFAVVRQMWEDGKSTAEVAVITGWKQPRIGYYFQKWKKEAKVVEAVLPQKPVAVLFINADVLSSGGLDSCCYLPTEEEAIKLGVLIPNTRYVRVSDIPECTSAGDYIDRFWRI